MRTNLSWLATGRRTFFGFGRLSVASGFESDLVQRLGLTPTGQVEVNHAGGVSQLPTYVVNLLLPNNVGIVGVVVTELQTAPDFGAIIGMDIIARGDLAITNVGNRTTVSFRFPSIKEIDYVVEANVQKYAGIGRNAPCPCGKGKKFKKCCKP